MHNFDLNIKDISKIEGKGSLNVKVRDGKIEEFKFAITEFKRFYTQAIRGKDVVALPQLSARICGTCSNAHLICAIKASENALGIIPSEQTKMLRELVNYGLNIRDHALHLYVFVMPDLLGIDNILELDENDPEEHLILDDTFQVKKAGNMLAKIIGGRSVHAPFLTVGGFTRIPDSNEFPKLLEELYKARESVLRLIRKFFDCSFSLMRQTHFVALMDRNYDFLNGKIQSSEGDVIDEGDFGKYLDHTVIPYSQASGYLFSGSLHMIGALARMNLGKQYLHKDTLKDAEDALSCFPSANIFHNNLAQAIEILHCIDKSVDILKNIRIADDKPVKVIRKAGKGVGVIEAPRGTLYYMIEINDTGKIVKGDIVVPTGQNQIGIEKSLFQFFGDNLGLDKDKLVTEAEKIIRAYDPCMSCASHFLKVKWL